MISKDAVYSVARQVDRFLFVGTSQPGKSFPFPLIPSSDSFLILNSKRLLVLQLETDIYYFEVLYYR